jgi:predicted MFS family arabinose efflux permease
MDEQDTESEPDEVGPTGRATFSSVFANAEFRALWTAQVLSVVGDQLARVALTLLVYDRTRSALLAAITFAASVVPAFVGGVTLAGLADRLPRRQVMIACDLVRAVLVIAMITPRAPLALLVILLFAVTMIGTPFTSARAALYADILSGDRYVVGNAVTLTTYQLAQVFGFAAGGAIVTFFGTRTSLLADAATFAVSALIVQAWVQARPAPRAAQPGPPSRLADLIDGIRLVFSCPALRTPMLLGWLAAFYNAPEGVAAPLARSLGSADAIGLLLAAAALGASAGAVAFSRLVRPSARLSWMRPLAVASCAVLILFALRPGLPLALAILFCSGLFDCYQVAANAAFVVATPQGQRSQAFGLAQAGMSLGQGAAMILAGAAAQHFAPTMVVAAAGALGAVTAVVISLTGSSRSNRAPVAGPAPG